jgi:hypothetical protein
VRSRNILLAACIAALAILPAPLCAQAGGPGQNARVSVTLHDGSIIVGELVANDSLSITVHTELFGQVLIARSKIIAMSGAPLRAPTPPSPSEPVVATPTPEQVNTPSSGTPSVQWTRTANISANYASGTVAGYNGETRGAELGIAIERISEILQFKLTIDAAYQVTDPNPESRNEAALSFVATRKLSSSFGVLWETLVEHNAVDELDYRIYQDIGISWTAVQSNKVTVLLAPGLGYTEEHGEGPTRLGDTPRQKFKDAHGIALGSLEQVTVRLPPAFTITEELFSFHAFDDNPRLQYTGKVKLVGMVSKHVGMSIEYKREFDSSVPAPINKTIERLSAGIQLAY